MRVKCGWRPTAANRWAAAAPADASWHRALAAWWLPGAWGSRLCLPKCP
jgi:hypothetical protein